MNDVWTAITDNFNDLPSAAVTAKVVVRLLLAAMLGAVLGYEREHRHQRAGMRTHMLISLGSATFTLVPQMAHMSDDAVSRVIQGLVAGIGFLGAGPILKLEQRMEVKGLTTAASIWVAAAVGMTAGLGRGMIAILTTVLALVILSLLPQFEHGKDDQHIQPAAGGA